MPQSISMNYKKNFMDKLLELYFTVFHFYYQDSTLIMGCLLLHNLQAPLKSVINLFVKSLIFILFQFLPDLLLLLYITILFTNNCLNAFFCSYLELDKIRQQCTFFFKKHGSITIKFVFLKTTILLRHRWTILDKCLASKRLLTCQACHRRLFVDILSLENWFQVNWVECTEFKKVNFKNF